MKTRREFLRDSVGVSTALLVPEICCAKALSSLERSSNGFVFTEGGAEICRIPSGGAEVEDNIRQAGPGHYIWRRLWKHVTPHSNLRAEVHTSYPATFLLVPQVSYNGNKEFAGRAHQGFSVDGQPWMLAGNRVAVPGGTYSEGKRGSVFLFADAKAPSAQCAFSLDVSPDHVVHRLLWPEQEGPKSYLGMPPYRKPLEVGADGDFEAHMHLVIQPVPIPRASWHNGLDVAWRSNRRAVKPWYTPQKCWDLGLAFARESLWYDKPEFTGFRMGFNRSGYDRGTSKDPWFEVDNFMLGCSGQQVTFANAFLHDYLWHKNKESLDRGQRTIDFWIGHGRLPNGLFYTDYSYQVLKWRGKGWGDNQGTSPNFVDPMPANGILLDTRNLGDGAYQILQASELAEKIGLKKPRWREAALAACDFFVAHTLPDGTFPRAWSTEGEPLAETGTIGAFLILPLLKAYRLTGKAQYLETARKAYRRYVERDLSQVVCSAGAIDQDVIDKETAWPLVMAGLDLYEITGDRSFVRDAEDAGYYLASWQCQFSIPMPPGSAMALMKYDTYGGTSVSVQAFLQDPWGGLIAIAWLRLAQATRKPIWRERAVAVWSQATIGVSDGNLVVNGAKRRIGSQNETFVYTNSSWYGREQGDANDWLVAWCTAHRLTTLMYWPDWKVLEGTA